MPSGCKKCKLMYFDGETDVCPFAGEVFSSDDVRSIFCPLAPVPSHGRLIDADVATKLCKTDAGIYDLTDTPEFLSYLPTIIPADEEGEE